jgi:hypothetical protein
MENAPFLANTALAYAPKSLHAVGGFLADWPPYSLDLSSLDFSFSCLLLPKGQATPHTNLAALCPSVTSEWDQLAAVQIRKNAAYSTAAVKPSQRKMKLKLNRWLAKSPAHTN